MIYKHKFISFSLVLILGFAMWMTMKSHRVHLDNTAKNAQLPDGYMEGVIAFIYDKQGKPSMKVITPKLLHYAENDTSQLTDPNLTLYRKSPQPWYITAKFAKSTLGAENVDFWDDVKIHHAGDINSPATVIKTTKLTVHPNKKIAETEDLITMIQPNLVVKATGMHADMNTGDIKLLSEARGEYAPS